MNSVLNQMLKDRERKRFHACMKGKVYNARRRKVLCMHVVGVNPYARSEREREKERERERGRM